MWFSWYDLEEEYGEAAPASVLGEYMYTKTGRKCLHHIESQRFGQKYLSLRAFPQ